MKDQIEEIRQMTEDEIDSAIDEVFSELHQKFNTPSGDISPDQSALLDKLKISLTNLISAQVIDNLKKQYTVTATTVEGIEDHEMDQDDIDNLEEIETPWDVWAISEDHAMTLFHDNIPIAIPDDFDITVKPTK